MGPAVQSYLGRISLFCDPTMFFTGDCLSVRSQKSPPAPCYGLSQPAKGSQVDLAFPLDKLAETNVWHFVVFLISSSFLLDRNGTLILFKVVSLQNLGWLVMLATGFRQVLELFIKCLSVLPRGIGSITWSNPSLRLKPLLHYIGITLPVSLRIQTLRFEDMLERFEIAERTEDKFSTQKERRLL